MKYNTKTSHHQQIEKLLYLLCMRYMLNISEEEKQALLAQHQQPYNGYQTLQLQKPSNRITVYDPAGDKHGVQVTANGGVRTYSNVNLREGKGEMCECGGMMYEGECMECGYKMEGTAKLQDKFDYVENYDSDELGDMDTHDDMISSFDTSGEFLGMSKKNPDMEMYEGEMCNECGSGMMYEGECNECGYTIKNPEPMYSQGFDYTNEEVSASLQEPYSEIDFGNYDFDSKGPMQFKKGKTDLDYSDELQKQQSVLDYSSQHDDDPDVRDMLSDLEDSMDSDYSGKEKLAGEKEAYDFDSDGPLATSGVFREMEDPEEIEKVKESIKESLNWFKRFSKYN